MLIKTDLAGRGVTVAPRASWANTHVAVGSGDPISPRASPGAMPAVQSAWG